MPTYRPTNAGLQTKGTLWGMFDPTTTAVLAGVFMGTVIFTFASISALKVNWVFATIVFFALPNTITLAAIFFLIMGKPPRYLLDWCDSCILRRIACRLDKIDEPRLPIDLQ